MGSSVLMIFEGEQTGIVFKFRPFEEIVEDLIDTRFFGDLAKLVKGLNATVFANTQENDAVNGHLDCVVQTSLIH